MSTIPNPQVDLALLQQGLEAVARALSVGKETQPLITGVYIDYGARRMMLTVNGATYRDTVAVDYDGLLIDVRIADNKPQVVTVPIDR